MSQPENARNMDESSRIGRSFKRGQTQVDLPGGPFPTMPEPLRIARQPQAPAGLQMRNDTIGIAISRPTPGPEWPLVGSVASPAFPDSESYRPPPGRSQPPQRPPRPSRVSSISDGSRPPDPASASQYASQNTSVSEISIQETPTPQFSRPSTLSSLDSIPDFHQPISSPNTPNTPPRRSVNLGPPPSSRRGASSFYSNASSVTPIPEEGSRVKSHSIPTSSAAIPEDFGSLFPSSNVDPYTDEMMADDSMLSDDADDSHLVRSASMGKRGRPSLVTTRSVDKSPSMRQQPSPEDTQDLAYADGAGANNGSSSSSTQYTVKDVGASGLTTNTMLSAFENASATDLSMVPRMESQSRQSRLSGTRRPPRLDMDAIKAAEARGSLTSLPDLIRRATRLASIMEKGKRPASRLDGLDFPDEIYGRDAEKNHIYELDGRQSSLSDMLAAFPPPASRHSMRHSHGSWPLPRMLAKKGEQHDRSATSKIRRRCCGLPIWGFLLLLLIAVSIIIAAVVVPVELLVVNKKNDPQRAQTCVTQLPCANGGTSVLSQGVCSCICPSDFTGTDCTTATTQGCTTIALHTEDTAGTHNVTIGQAIPRLVLNAQSNFSVPLDTASIVSKLSSARLSCTAENALVTFEGPWPGMLNHEGGKVHIERLDSPVLTQPLARETGRRLATTLTVGGPNSPSQVENLDDPPQSTSTSSQESHTSSETSSATSTTTPNPTRGFAVTEQMVEFARVAVLFVLQEKTIDQASVAQSSIQTFLDHVDSKTTASQAGNITIGNSNSIDLVNFRVDVGARIVGGGGNN
ncbi:hypothetical protein GGS21DRAFT_259370 [Xylaria nigripes]|nr:hypothetical protein GGS21DRAFT_259370 [Xylaria nigripes]